MRRFAPALGERLSRRNIALSPQVWTITGLVFAIFAISNAVIAFAFDVTSRPALLVLALVLGAVSAAVLATRPPEPGTRGAHAFVASAYVGTAAAVCVFCPAGSASLMAGVFTGPLIAIWMQTRRAVAAHVGLATLVLVAAILIGRGDPGTIFAALCYVPGLIALTVCCVLTFEAIDAQTLEYERLALRDPLTGIGNAATLEEALRVEVPRHRSSGAPLTLVELRLADFGAVNRTVGRAAGDSLLATIAGILSDRAPTGSTVARIAGDRFAVLLPGALAPAGRDLVDTVVADLERIDVGEATLGLHTGIAAFPHDAPRGSTLREVAGVRLAASRAITIDRRDAGYRIGGLAVHTGDAAPIPQRAPAGTPSPDAREDGWAATRVSRRGIARDRVIWRATGAIVLLYALLAGAVLAVDARWRTPAVLAATTLGLLVALALLAMRPPALGSRRNHAVIASTWLLPLVAMAACAPHASWGVGTALFAGVLCATRLQDRREILAHLCAFSGGLWALMLSGRVDTTSVLAGLTLLLSTWVLVICTTTIFEAAEAQGRRMAELVLRDPLTGAGNARLLRERLADEIPRHEAMQMPLVVAEIELSGLGEVRDREGRGAADDLLRDAAVILASAGGQHATVARVHGERFQLLVPLTGADDTAALTRDIRLALAGTSRRKTPVLPRIGAAVLPDDAADQDELLRLAHARMAADDPRAHDLSAADPLDEPLPVRRRVQWPSTDDRERRASRRRSAG